MPNPITIATISSAVAGQFVKKVPGQPEVPATSGVRVDLNNAQQNVTKKIDTSESGGIYSANEFDPTALNGSAADGRVATIITTEQRMMGGKLLQNLPDSALKPDLNATARTKAAAKAREDLQRLGWKIDSNGKPVIVDDFGRPRNPFQAIILHINPSEAQFGQGIRGAESKNKSGTVLYTWRDPKRKTFFDEPTVTLTFHTGNMLPFTYMGGVSNPSSADWAQKPIPRGLANYYRFMEILDDRKILPDGRPNFVYITHSSRLYPKLTLVGFFTPEGVQIQETAQEPNQISWSATLNCRFTYPHLSDSRSLIDAYHSMASRIVPPVSANSEDKSE